MAMRVRFFLPKTHAWAEHLSALGVLGLFWDERGGAWEGRATSKTWTAIGQQPHLNGAGEPNRIPLHRMVEVLGNPNEDHGKQVSTETLRKFARAAAVADGNAFFGPLFEPADEMEAQYFPEAETAARVLEGLGIDPDAFAANLLDPGSSFAKLVPPTTFPAPAEGGEEG